MTYRGRVRNGAVVLEGPVALPEGAEVRVILVADDCAIGRAPGILAQKLLRYAGKATGLPADAARQHDHYLYGTPKE